MGERTARLYSHAAQLFQNVKRFFAMFSDLGAIGEFIGGLGVIITLVYLAIEIRLNRRAVSSAAAESVMQSMSAFYQALGNTPELASLMTRGVADFESLSEDQKSQCYLWLFSWFRLVEVAHTHQSAGQLPKGFWDGQVLHLASILRNQVVQDFWAARKPVFSTSFQAVVDGLDPSNGTLTTAEALARMTTEVKE